MIICHSAQSFAVIPQGFPAHFKVERSGMRHNASAALVQVRFNNRLVAFAIAFATNLLPGMWENYLIYEYSTDGVNSHGP